jgi:predicted GTPase
VDVRIGIAQSVKELEVDLGDGVERDAVLEEIDQALKAADGVLWLTDRKGRRVGVPVAKVAYVEIGAPATERRVGFGAP